MSPSGPLRRARGPGPTVGGVDPSFDGDHGVNVRVFTDAAGTPGAQGLVDGAPVLP